MGRWRGLALKKGTSPEIVNWLAAVLKKASNDPSYKDMARRSPPGPSPGLEGSCGIREVLG
ncbi:MAG: hypothetical protein MZV70_12540 [Desulfobacterales bacterium]|nr:hypothetical protein [Desulfobacterales bacterium]